MRVNMISLSPKRARVRTILWLVFSIALLSNIAGVLFTTSVVYAFDPNSISTDVNGDGVVNILDLNVLVIAFGSYPGYPTWSPRADVNDNGLVDISDIALVARDYDARAYTTVERLWSADSYWYMKIKANPALYPDSAAMIDRLIDNHAKNPGINWKAWTHSVYEAYEDTPVYHVYCSDYGHYVDIPFPDPYPISIPSDADAAVSVVDWHRGMTWSIGVIKATGGTYTCKSYTQMPIGGKGYQTWGTFWYGGGSGCVKLSYMIRPEEIEAGVINHALGFCAHAIGPWTDGSRHDLYEGFVYPPAVHTDRETTSSNPLEIPEGARIQLDPAIDLDALFGANPTGLMRTGKIIAKCLQDYGMVGVEAGGGWVVYAEHDLTADWNPPSMGGGALSPIGSLVTSSYNPWRVIDFDLYPTVDDLSEYE